MIQFGYTRFVCDECKHKFRGPHYEYMATCYAWPLECPSCGSYHTMPWSLFGSNKSIYKKIWADRDRHIAEMKQNQQSK